MTWTVTAQARNARMVPASRPRFSGWLDAMVVVAAILAQWNEVAALYDQRFCRYLAFSELAFRHLHCMVIQVQLTKQVGVLPIVQTYMAEAEARYLR